MAQPDTSRPVFYTEMAVLLKEQNEYKETASNNYDILLMTLKNPNTEVGPLVKIIQDLEQCISILDNSHQLLVGVIMKMKWLQRSPELTSAYQSFMVNLISAHMFYLKPCLKMLVACFLSEDKTQDSPSQANTQKRLVVYEAHALLKAICDIVPLASVTLLQTVELLFPYINKSVQSFEQYTHNIFYLTCYLPAAKRLEVWEILVKNMLKLDVRNSRREISAAVHASFSGLDGEQGPAGEIFYMEGCGDGQVPRPESMEDRLAAAAPQAASLDAMMTLTFQFIREYCHVDGKLDWDITKRLYRELLSVFDKFIFPTHASSHVQFIMFFICSFREALADGFLDYLWKKVTDPSAESLYRQSAASYISSFLTAANYLSIRTVKESVELMVKWVHCYLDHLCDQWVPADLAHHGPFYSLCQSVFYIFCFKHSSFLDMKKGHRWAESLNFQRIVTSKLNPLRICSPSVVGLFSSISRLHQLAFCDTIIERNNRYNIPISGWTFCMDDNKQQVLESALPFDPYLLPRSGQYILPLYNDFKDGIQPRQEVSVVERDEDDFLPSEDEQDMSRHTLGVIMSLGKSPVDCLELKTPIYTE